MSIWEHSRFRIFNPAQHPLKHSLADFGFSNPRLPGIATLQDAFNYVIAVLYPDYIGTWANYAALIAAQPAPASNSYAIVSDDGAGNAAGYIFQAIDGAGQWIKRYDMAWSMDSILSETVNRTMPLYPAKYGADDKDASGITITGVYAGQSIYGGASASTNLTLRANAGDPAGTHSGFIQFDDDVRPAADNSYKLGTTANRFSGIFTYALTSGTLSASAGSITDTSGSISFGTTNLVTTGSLGGKTLAITQSGVISTLSFATGSITDSTGTISLGTTALTTTGTITGAASSVLANLTFGSGSITSGSGALSFGSNNLTTTGLITGNTGVIQVQLDAANLRISGNTLSAQNSNGSITLAPNGTGQVLISGPAQITGNLTSTTGNMTTGGYGQFGNLMLSGDTLSTQDTNGTLTIQPNGTGLVAFGSGVYPGTDNAKDSGKSLNRWAYLWIAGGFKDGTNTYTISDLMRLRNNFYRDAARTQPAQNGDALFYDSTSGSWLASIPDTEINHSSLSGLTTGDAGHTQFVMLTGRAGGQVVQGGTAASDNLTLESTSNATKGSVFTKDSFKAFTDASYSSSWSGTDLGDSTHNFRHLYSKGEHKGLRLENVLSSALPSSSGANAGRVVFATDNNKIYVDTGTSLIIAGVGKYLSDTTWNGVQTTQTFTVSASISNAQNAIWAIHDNANNYERIYAQITAPTTTTVTVTVSSALPSGSYRLIGIE